MIRGRGQPSPTPSLPTTDWVQEMCAMREAADRMRIQVTQMRESSQEVVEMIRQGNELLREIVEATRDLAAASRDHAAHMDTVRQAVEEDVRERQAARRSG